MPDRLTIFFCQTLVRISSLEKFGVFSFEITNNLENKYSVSSAIKFTAPRFPLSLVEMPTSC
jgi:hypothetical protein